MQQQLRDFGLDASRSTADLGAIRARRTTVTREIDKVEKLLEEAELILGGHATSLATAS